MCNFVRSCGSFTRAKKITGPPVASHHVHLREHTATGERDMSTLRLLVGNPRMGVARDSVTSAASRPPASSTIPMHMMHSHAVLLAEHSVLSNVFPFVGYTITFTSIATPNCRPTVTTAASTDDLAVYSSLAAVIIQTVR